MIKILNKATEEEIAIIYSAVNNLNNNKHSDLNLNKKSKWKIFTRKFIKTESKWGNLSEESLWKIDSRNIF